MAGIALGRWTGDNGNTLPRDFRGVAPNADLIDIKVQATRVSTPGQNCTNADLIRGFEKCIQERTNWNIQVANVSNMALNHAAAGMDCVSMAANRLVMSDVVVVAAVGNFDPILRPNDVRNTVGAPAAGDYVIAVVGSNPNSTSSVNDDSADGSSFQGPREPRSIDELKPDIAAPSFRIWTTPHDMPAGLIRIFGGASIATAYVSGVAALVRQVNPTMSPLNVRQLLRDTAQTPQLKGAPGWHAEWGFGVVDAFAAIDRLRSAPLKAVDLGFDEHCNLPPPASFSSKDLGAGPLGLIFEGHQTQVQAKVTNYSSTNSDPVEVSFGVHEFGNSRLASIIGTKKIPSVLANSSTTVYCDWTPQASGKFPGVTHACIRVEIIYPSDTKHTNNCAQRNVLVIETGSPARFRAKIVNPTGKDIRVVFENDLGEASGWTLQTTPKIEILKADDCPRIMELSLTPDANTKGDKTVNITVRGFSSDPDTEHDLGGFTIKAIRPKKNE